MKTFFTNVGPPSNLKSRQPTLISQSAFCCFQQITTTIHTECHGHIFFVPTLEALHFFGSPNQHRIVVVFSIFETGHRIFPFFSRQILWNFLNHCNDNAHDYVLFQKTFIMSNLCELTRVIPDANVAYVFESLGSSRGMTPRIKSFQCVRVCSNPTGANIRFVYALTFFDLTFD